MADQLALSWDRNRLTGIEISPGAAGPRILAAFSVDWPEQPPTATWLRETLRRHGINAKQVVLGLPREDAVLRLLELPAVSDDELPTLVRFQAAARSAQPIDQLHLDYLPLPLRAGVSQKEVWLATAVQTTVEPIRKLLEGAGLELIQLTLSSLCLTELIARGEAAPVPEQRRGQSGRVARPSPDGIGGRFAASVDRRSRRPLVERQRDPPCHQDAGGSFRACWCRCRLGYRKGHCNGLGSLVTMPMSVSFLRPCPSDGTVRSSGLIRGRPVAYHWGL